MDTLLFVCFDYSSYWSMFYFFFQAEDGIRDYKVTGVQTCALPIFEGSEVAALLGARGLLSREDRPSILFEHNPVALSERGIAPRCLSGLLSGYHFQDRKSVV